MHGGGWAAGIFPSPTVLVPPRLIQTAFHPTELRRVLPAVVDDATIGEIDRALVQMFGL